VGYGAPTHTDYGNRLSLSAIPIRPFILKRPGSNRHTHSKHWLPLVEIIRKYH